VSGAHQPVALHVTLQVDASLLGGDLLHLIREALAAGRITSGTAPVGGIRQPPAPAAERTVSHWLVVYRDILARRPYKPATLVNHTSNLKHIERLWGHMPIRSVKARHITAAAQDAFGSRAALARRVMDHLKDVMQEALINEWIDVNPVLATRRVRVKVTRKRMSLETFNAMAEVATAHRQPWVSPMILLGLVTGQRRADLAKMRFDDVVDGYLHVEQQKEAGKGYGARVAIPLSLRLDVLGLTVGEVIDLCRHYDAPGPTLLRKTRGRPLELSSLSVRFHEVIRAALGDGAYGPREWPSLHELRSLSERLYRAQGVDTQTLLGHSSKEMTDKYNDDRGLTAKQFKRVKVSPEVTSSDTLT
jgi:integrase